MMIDVMMYGYAIGSMVMIGTLELLEMAGVILWVWVNSSKTDVVLDTLMDRWMAHDERKATLH